jgi:dihydrofolate reductase
MGALINDTSMTADGLVEVDDDWFVGEGDHDVAACSRFEKCEAMLLGRKTYDGIADFWQSADGRWADAINPMPKYVGSRSLHGELPWNATALDGDVVEQVAQLKEQHDGDLFLTGCGEFTSTLLAAGLVDEVHLWVHPSLGGAGARPFGAAGKRPMELLEARSFDSGVALLRYAPS